MTQNGLKIFKIDLIWLKSLIEQYQKFGLKAVRGQVLFKAGFFALNFSTRFAQFLTKNLSMLLKMTQNGLKPIKLDLNWPKI